MFIDITKIMDCRTPIYEDDPRFEKREIFSVKENGFSVSEIKFGSHFATHIDAPRHFFENGKTVSQLDINKLCGNADVVSVFSDVDEKSALSLCGKNKIILLKAFNNGGVTEDGARAFAEKGIELIGINSMDIEAADHKNFPAHKVFLAKEIPILENLELENVQDGEYRLICLPLKIKDIDACPVRAILEEF